MQQINILQKTLKGLGDCMQSSCNQVVGQADFFDPWECEPPEPPGSYRAMAISGYLLIDSNQTKPAHLIIMGLAQLYECDSVELNC